MKNFIAKGDVVALTVGNAAVASGEGYLAGGIFGVAVNDVAANGSGQFAREGIFDLPKVSAQAWTQGADIYWNATDKVCTTASTGHTMIGKAAAVAANPSATGLVLLG